MRFDGRKGGDTYLRGCTRFFQFSDDGERIYLLHVTYTDPEARGYRLLTLEWVVLLACARVSFRMVVL